MAYASVQDVNTYTGASVDSAAVTRAQAIVELYSNRTESASGHFTTRDLQWLKLAVCYQAAYADANPEATTLMDVSSYAQGDISIAFRDGGSDGAVLAPLARRALNKLSWTGSRSVSITTGFITEEDAAEDDEPESWEAF